MNKADLADWLVINQKECPVCGASAHKEMDLHHLWHRRLKLIDKLLWVPINISLVCNPCHVPETEKMNYKCAMQKFGMGFTPDRVRAWLKDLPLKVKPGFPAFFIEAEEAWEGGER